MTAVASPPSVQTGPRVGWFDTGNGGQGAFSSMDAEEVSRTFMPRKTVQRSNSSSSLRSNGTTSTTVALTEQNPGAVQPAPDNTWGKKKPARNLWHTSNSEPQSLRGIAPSSQPMPAFSSGPGAMSAVHQPPSIVPSQHMMQLSQQQNGLRAASVSQGDPPAILTLLPINGTFEKKQITVPFYPDVIRIGRQTNAKTVPTPVNGFFDSKVLSRQHAEIWADKTGKVWIRDVKSSNGTFVNGKRLSQENRESDPHELRENDTLELGIDIVSEDQKTIVHHKVSAKVEHAGIYASIPNILDLTLGDLDPSAGNGLVPSPLTQPLLQIRGRSGSTMSNRSAQSAASSQFNALQQQRQMNYWNSPISIEQVVKRLTSEMKQAKQQSQELRQTDEFLTTLMKPGQLEKEKPKHSPPDTNAARAMNGRPKIPRLDSFSRFSEPPAPPPQQPLPEKPDALPRNGTDSLSPLKRSDTEKPKLGGSSPVSRDNSQILSLIEALSSAKRELDTQGARVKELEAMLIQERTARESAEEKARTLEMRTTTNGLHATPVCSDADHENTQTLPAEKSAEEPAAEVVAEAAIEAEQAGAPDVRTDDIQHRLETMIQEMEEMRKQVTIFKEQAQHAESERNEVRKSLAEMIETLRRERAERAEGDAKAEESRNGHVPDTPIPETEDVAGKDISEPSEQRLQPAASSCLKGSDGADSKLAAPSRRHDVLEQSSPFASMLGVVLLGVGLMAYLNGWQKMDK
ncbi:putative cytoplasm to vacuole targeting Vps64 [Aspergillus homomorphus CBS 101889]|uniref:Putative cytoplasm to vacuole targeting Vps64 n=1 Tax=Aspergillus homomorphus (strain CBS 101889) TaxID=1450537 RepID=A0A395HRX9_ASPHC|nr:putative cytoplasm to vacuole targeting Vps64 [Aspergillus homomorphus CBS 101889]RAL10306.1 putative cytoplasm to vacuole targeting Vps64 [Aspergillus homomorphus CBS 101889]